MRTNVDPTSLASGPFHAPWGAVWGRSRRRIAPLLAVGLVVTAIGASGCSGGGTTAVAPSASKTSAEPAKAAVVSFLEAIKRGDDTAAAAMLTSVARTKTQELGLAVAPPVNPTARYEVRECEAVGDGGDLVHVGTVWTDTDEAGQETSESIVWVARLDPEGWRVVGMAMKVFDDLPPLLLNFEDPDDMIAKQELVAQELQRRAEAAESREASTAGADAAGGVTDPPAAVTAQPPAAERRR